MSVITDSELPSAKALKELWPERILPEGTVPDLMVALINLMPDMQATEADFLRLMVQSETKVKVTLVNMASHTSRHTPKSHTDKFYTHFDRLTTMPDGVIITGAPLENVVFEDVDYWPEITGIFDTLHSKDIPTLHICWAAFAALYHRFGIEMKLLERKLSGVYPHTIHYKQSPLMQDISEPFFIPHSRFAAWDQRQIDEEQSIRTVASGTEQGPYLISSVTHPEHFITGHGEYAANTLDREYCRDLGKGMNPHIPVNYYPDDDPTRPPTDRWHDTALTIMDNWLREVAAYANHNKT